MHIFHLKSLWSLEICSWKSAKLGDKSKSRPNDLFHWTFARFSKVFVFNKDLRDTERILKLAHICVDAWQNLKNVTGCRQFDETNSEKTGQIFFSDEEIASLDKIFWQLPYPYRNDLISYQLYKKGQKTSWSLINCFLRFVILGNTRRKTLLFFIGMFAFLSFSSKYFVFNNFSGLWELTFLLAPILLEYFVERDKIVTDVCKTRYYEKKCEIVFFHWKGNIFSKTSVFNIHSVVAEMIL